MFTARLFEPQRNLSMRSWAGIVGADGWIGSIKTWVTEDTEPFGELRALSLSKRLRHRVHGGREGTRILQSEASHSFIADFVLVIVLVLVIDRADHEYDYDHEHENEEVAAGRCPVTGVERDVPARFRGLNRKPS